MSRMALMVWMLASCAPDHPESVAMVGAVEKGPFLLGSTVMVSMYDIAGGQTGRTYVTRTTDDQGAFALSLPVGRAQIEASGYWYDEVRGSVSTGHLTLRGWYSFSLAPAPAYVNVLTHLAHPRTEALWLGGMSLAVAATTAEDELVTALGLGGAGFSPATHPFEMSLLGGDTDDNAYLLLVSTLLAQVAHDRADDVVDATLQGLLDALAADLADGTLDPAIVAELVETQATVDWASVLVNLEARLAEIGSGALAPDIHRVLDGDLDGTVDQFDTDADDDGYVRLADGGDDCDDYNPAVHPGRTDVLGDGYDADCDGYDTHPALLGTVSTEDATATRYANTESGACGSVVEPVGDTNGDVFADVLVGCWNSATVYLVRGPILGTASLDGAAAVFESTLDWPLAYGITVGDLDSDGTQDIATLSGWNSRMDLHFGPIEGQFHDRSGAAWIELESVAAVGGGELDGYPARSELVLSNTRADDGGTDAGAILVFTDVREGRIDVDDAVATIQGDAVNDLVGGALRILDDDGDGADDIAYTAGGDLSVVRGPLLAFTTDAAADGHLTGVPKLYYVEAVGDVTGDGIDDVVVAAFGDAYLLAGPIPASGAFDLLNVATILTGKVRGLGDIDADGYSDLGQSATTEARILYGPVAGTVDPSTASLIIDEPVFDHFGYLWPNAAGDLNADGFADLLVGAPGHDGGKGGFHIFLGGY